MEVASDQDLSGSTALKTRRSHQRRMRAGPIVAGAILLVVGLAAAIGGGMMKSAAEYCLDARCDDSGEAFMLGVVGNGIFLGGALAGLAGIGLVVAGVVAEPKARVVPVSGAPAMRPCPSCNEPTPTTSKYCIACGCAIAPVLAPK